MTIDVQMYEADRGPKSYLCSNSTSRLGWRITNKSNMMSKISFNRASTFFKGKIIWNEIP